MARRRIADSSILDGANLPPEVEEAAERAAREVAAEEKEEPIGYPPHPLEPVSRLPERAPDRVPDYRLRTREELPPQAPEWSTHQEPDPGSYAPSMPVGRASAYNTDAPVVPLSVPLWPRHASYPTTCRLLVYRQEADFRTVEIGSLAKDATIAGLLAKWPQSGTYFIQPVNDQGNPLERDMIRKDIPPDHEMLRRGGGGIGGGASPSGTSDPGLVSLLQQQLSAQNTRMAYLERLLEAQTQRAATEQDRISRERLALASEHAGSVVELQNRLIDRWGEKEAAVESKTTKVIEAAQHAQASAMDRTQSVLTQFLTEQAKARADALDMERRRMDSELEARKLELKAERERMEADAKRQEADLKTRLAMIKAEADERESIRQKWHDAEMDRVREHQKAMQDIRNQQSNPLAAAEGLVKAALPLVAPLMPHLGTIIGAFSGQTAEPETLMGGLVKLGSKFLELQKVNAQVRAGMPVDEEEEDDPAYQPGVPQLTGPAPGYVPPPQGYAPPQPQPIPPGGMQAPAPSTETAPPAGNPPQDAAGLARVRVGQLPTDVQRKGRKAARVLVDAIRRLPANATEEQVAAALFPVLASVPDGSLEMYLAAATIYGAAIEAGADPALAEKIVGVMDKHGLGPGIPRR